MTSCRGAIYKVIIYVLLNGCASAVVVVEDINRRALIMMNRLNLPPVKPVVLHFPKCERIARSAWAYGYTISRPQVLPDHVDKHQKQMYRPQRLIIDKEQF